MFDEKNYERPSWIKTADIINGVRASKEEIDRMCDWKENPRMGLSNWVYLVGQKN